MSPKHIVIIVVLVSQFGRGSKDDQLLAVPVSLPHGSGEILSHLTIQMLMYILEYLGLQERARQSQ